MIDSSSFDEMESRGHTLRRLRWTGAATGEATASAEGPERRKADGSGTPAYRPDEGSAHSSAQQRVQRPLLSTSRGQEPDPNWMRQLLKDRRSHSCGRG